MSSNIIITNEIPGKNLFQYISLLDISDKSKELLRHMLYRAKIPTWKLNQLEMAKSINTYKRKIERCIDELKKFNILKLEKISSKEYKYHIFLKSEPTKKQQVNRQIVGRSEPTNHVKTDRQNRQKQTDKSGGYNIKELNKELNNKEYTAVRCVGISKKFLDIANDFFDFGDNKNIKNKDGEVMGNEFNLNEILGCIDENKITLKIEEQKEKPKELVSIPGPVTKNLKKDFYPSDIFQGIKLKLFNDLKDLGFGRPGKEFDDIKSFLFPINTKEETERLRQIIEVAKISGYGAGWVRNKYNDPKFSTVKEGSAQSKTDLDIKNLNEITKKINRALELPVGDNLQGDTFRFFSEKVIFLQKFNADKSIAKEKFYLSEKNRIESDYQKSSLPLKFKELARSKALKNLDERFSTLPLKFKDISNKALQAVNTDIDLLRLVLEAGSRQQRDYSPEQNKVSEIISMIVNYSDTENFKQEAKPEPETTKNNIIDITKNNYRNFVGNMFKKFI